ncbi:metallophosphoesterase [Variovorax sp. dw_308]|uniref:metallophosphoesterase n=1 Tax=Variovorax sp. dw_308 TaxID=2721546 RepID=UPI001C4695EA|nr:metallophosphoesterase [Variovorax sp. dw_308]
MNDLPAFDEVHVISDLHMGGRPGFQILRETRRLANHVVRLGQQRPEGQLALVLNGDVFDTLAEEGTGYVAIDNAVDVVSRIMKDDAFAPIWDALAAFVGLPGRTLVIVIGNHDIEIAFPTVQRLVKARLAGADPIARSRIEFSTAGAGFTCTVGGARVHCIHGNEVDPWNYNRYEDLARVSRHMNAGQPLPQDAWQPNAGTRMVKDVMNAVKRRYAWIDLLKPETSAAVGALLVLDPTRANKLDGLFGVAGERSRGSAQVDARLSADQAQSPAPAASAGPTLEQMLGPNLKQGVARPADDMLMLAEKNYDASVQRAVGPDGTLGVPQLAWDRLTGWLTGVTKVEALRRALADWLAKDKSFELTDRDETYTKVSESVGSAIDFVVCGHTHLERAIDMGAGRYYFNSGTWIRLLRLTPDMLRDEASFAPVYDVLVDGSMKAIDEKRFAGDKPFVLDQTSAVSICRADGEVVGSLAHVEGDGSGAPRVVASFSRH